MPPSLFPCCSIIQLPFIVFDSLEPEHPLRLLIEGEEIVAAFRTIRDQLVFTNKRIISIDVQGLTGLKKSFAIMPYSKVQFFTIQTPGFAELVSDSELYLMFSNGFTAKFEFRGSVDIGALGRTISTYVL